MTRQYNKTIPDDWKFITKESRLARGTTDLRRLKLVKALDGLLHFPSVAFLSMTERQQITAMKQRIGAGGNAG